MHISTTSLVACATTATLVVSLGASAHAVEPPSDVDDVPQALEVAPDLGEVVQPTRGSDGDDLVAELPGGGSVDISSEGGGEVSLSSPGRTSIVLALPEEVETADAVVAEDGTIVYASTTALGAAVAVQALPDSVSIQTVIPDARSPHSFTYELGEGVHPELRPDGGVDLVVDSDGVITTVGHIATPWAVDANGSAVPTEFDVVGSTVRQVVTVSSSSAYPVVADPLLTYGWGVYMNLKGAEWKALGAAVAGTSVGVSTAACLGAKLPAAWAKAVGSVCTLIGVSTGITAFTSALEEIASWKLAAGSCYQLQILSLTRDPSIGRLTKVADSQCLP